METLFSRTLENGRDGFEALLGAIEEFLIQKSPPDNIVHRVMISCDEVISNILNHASKDGASKDRASKNGLPKVSARIAITPGNVSVKIIDNGPEFDPLSVPPPDTDLSVEDRKVGGLGIHLVRELMDGVSYSRENGENHLRFHKIYPL